MIKDYQWALLLELLLIHNICSILRFWDDDEQEQKYCISVLKVSCYFIISRIYGLRYTLKKYIDFAHRYDIKQDQCQCCSTNSLWWQHQCGDDDINQRHTAKNIELCQPLSPHSVLYFRFTCCLSKKSRLIFFNYFLFLWELLLCQMIFAIMNKSPSIKKNKKASRSYLISF